ncbi:MAG: aspartate aminotransferase [Candidatus Atribacteria bacterium]|nr:aspartate aminotransferase [Candidatus Atribacteria bacterium]
MYLSDRVKNIAPSATLAISSRAKAMKKDGIDVISFSAGEPDFDTPSPIKEAAKQAIDQGFTKYTPVGGTLELKQAISQKLLRENNLHYGESEIIVSCGAKHSLYNAILSLCNPGDEVLLPKPYWVTYLEQIKLAEAKPILLDCNPATLQVEIEKIEEAISPRTRLFILNNPSNPSGVIWEEETLEKIALLAQKHDFYLVSDEIYEHLVYDNARPKSIATFPGMKERTVIINGVSKTFSMTGWRIGYAAGPKPVVDAMAALQSHSTSNPTSISQKASLAALECDPAIIQNMVSRFGARRKLMMDKISSVPEVRFPVPKGAFYLFADFSPYLEKSFQGKIISSSLTLSELLLQEARVATVPGIAFGMEGFLRLSYATSEELIEEGMNRLVEFLISL